MKTERYLSFNVSFSFCKTETRLKVKERRKELMLKFAPRSLNVNYDLVITNY